MVRRAYAQVDVRMCRVVGRPGVGAQAPLKTIEDGALDNIQLFVPALEQVTDLTVVIKPFDAVPRISERAGKTEKRSARRSRR